MLATFGGSTSCPRDAGDDEEDFPELNAIVVEEGSFRELDEPKSRLRRWIGRAAGTVASEGTKATFNVATSVITKALMEYYGPNESPERPPRPRRRLGVPAHGRL